MEDGDTAKAQKFYDRLAAEVWGTPTKYPEIAETLESMLWRGDEELEHIDALMRDAE